MFQDTDVVINRLPPQDIEIEKAVLGAILIEPGKDISVIDFLTPESFYDPRHQKIFKAIRDLSLDLKPIDQLTVVEQLRKNGELDEIGGPAYIIELTQKVASASHLEFHAKIVAQKYIQREMIKLANKLQEKAYDDTIDVEDLLDFAQKQLFDLVSQNIKNETRHIADILAETLKHIEDLGNRDIDLSGVPSGFTELDRVTSGWQNSDLILIAARPSMGKTAFILSMARNMAVIAKKKVAIFSLEMKASELVYRLISAEAEINSKKLKTGKLTDNEWTQLEEKLKPLENADIFIDDTPSISLFELRSKCRKIQTQYGLDVVMIDYLQLMSGPTDSKMNREQEVSRISRGLKALAKELDVPIIALSQLNRSIEHRTGKRPQLSDLRESGSLEQDADIVIFIHRPEKMGIDEFDDGTSTKGIAEIIIAKFRNGPTTEVKLRFINEYAKFENFDLDDVENIIPEDAIRAVSKMNDDTDFSDDDTDIDFPSDISNTDFDDQKTPF